MKGPASVQQTYETAALRGTLADLVGLLALSATWVGREAHEIGTTLCEALRNMLVPDVVSVALYEAPPFTCTGSSLSGGTDSVAVENALAVALGSDPAAWPSSTECELLGRHLRIITLPIGANRSLGTVAVASVRAGFPTPAESLVLNVARNQAILALQEARLRREAGRRAAERTAISVIEGIPGLVAVLGADGRLVQINRQIEEYCGQSVEELRAWESNGTIHPDDLSRVTKTFNDAIRFGRSFDIEQRLRRYDGTYRWFSNRGRPERDRDGNVLAWHVLLSDIDELKHAQESVRAREQELRQQSETFPQMLWSATAQGSIDYCNERLLKYSGLPASEVLNGRWTNLLHPDDREPTAAIWQRCVETGEPYSVEVRHYNQSQQDYRWNLTLALPLRNSEGKIVKWYGSCVDIHDRKLAEEAVRASERHLSQIIQTIPQNLFGASADGLVNYLNPQMREWFGRGDETIMADEWVHLVHPDDRDATVKAWTNTVSAGTSYHHQVRFVHRSGAFRWCEVRAQALRDRKGKILAWHGVVDDIHDRKLAEEALKQSEQSLRLIIDTIPVLAWSARSDGTADFFNRHYLDYVGLEPESLAGWHWLNLVHPEDLAVIQDAWRIARDRSQTGAIEARLRRHDGTYRWFLFQTSPLRDDNGGVARWYGVNTDIEDRKRAEQDLETRESKLREAHDHLNQAQRLSHTGSFTTDVLTDTHVWSDELYRILDCSPDMTPSFPVFHSQIHLDDVPGFDAAFRRAMADRSDFDHVFRVITPRGNQKHLHAVAHFVQASERPVVIGSIQDITESKRHEEELRRGAYLLETAERISETGSFHWDLTSNKIAWSAGMYRIHEMDDHAEPAYLDTLALIHPDDVERVRKRSKELATGPSQFDDSYRLLMPDGRVKHLRVAYRVMTLDDRRVEGVGVAQDVTKRQAAEDALDKLRSELTHITRVSSLGQLAASIAHEVNQPLSGIVTNASTGLRLLASHPPDIDGVIKTAQRTIRDANRASEVIQRLRRLYHKQEFVADELDLNGAAKEVIEICRHDLHRRGIGVTVDLIEPSPIVNGDRIQLQQVILNLVLNAADAIEAENPKTRHILVETSLPSQNNAQLTVQDTGKGVSAVEIDRVFDAFYTTKPHGMGIGLSVSRSIIDRHGGKISVRSDEGKGAAFSFTIPLA